jgi:hypothetical protein
MYIVCIHVGLGDASTVRVCVGVQDWFGFQRFVVKRHSWRADADRLVDVRVRRYECMYLYVCRLSWCADADRPLA